MVLSVAAFVPSVRGLEVLNDDFSCKHYSFVCGCAPDYGVAVDHLGGPRHLNTEERDKIMAHLGVPFLLDIQSDSHVYCAMDTVALLSKHKGICMRHSLSTLHGLYFIFYPSQQERWYSPQRIHLLNEYFFEPKENLDKILRNKYSAKAEDLELERITASQTLEELGLILIPLYNASKKVSLLSFADLVTKWLPEGLYFYHIPQLISRPVLHLDSLAHLHRRADHQRLKQKWVYQEEAEDVHRELLTAQELIRNVFKNARKEYYQQELESHHRSVLLKELKKEREIMHKKRTEKMRETKQKALEKRMSENIQTQKLRRETACLQLQSAARTLFTENHDIDPQKSADYRYQLFFQLSKKYGCSVRPMDMSKRNTEPQKDPVQQFSQVDVCSQFDLMATLNRENGYSNPIPQNWVLLLPIYMSLYQKELKNKTAVGEERNSEASFLFDEHAFISFVRSTVQQDSLLAAISECSGARSPEAVNLIKQWRGELWYFLSSIELLIGEKSLSSPDRAQGVLHLYQAMWYGSHEAAGMLATLREHGIFVPQQEKAAASLLQFSMLQQGSSDVLFQLLGKVKKSFFLGSFLGRVEVNRAAKIESNSFHSTSSSSLEISAHPSAEVPIISLHRLLRHQPFYRAFTGSWHRVSAPITTKTDVQNVMLMGEDRPKNDDDDDGDFEEDVDESMANHRADAAYLRAGMLMSGFNGVKKDIRKAECALLVSLRKYGFYCDMHPQLYGVFLTRRWSELCPEVALVVSDSTPTIPCRYGPNPPPHAKLPHSRSMFLKLSRVLSGLSYLYMVQQRLELSGFYAMLSLDLSFTIYQAALAHATRMTLATGKQNITSTDAPWYSAQLVTKPNSTEFLAFVDSPFASTKPLLLLSLVRMTVSIVKASEAVDIIMRYVVREIFQVKKFSDVDTPLSRVFMFLIATVGHHKNEENIDAEEQSNIFGALDSFFTLIWLSKQMIVNQLPYTPEDLLSWSWTYRNILGDGASSFLPHYSDSWEGYMCRLGSIAFRDVERTAAVRLLLRLGVHCEGAEDTFSKSRTGFLFDRAPSMTLLSYLRIEKDYDTSFSHTRPLFLSSDIQMYSNYHGYSLAAKIADMAMNKLYRLYSVRTPMEKLASELMESIFPNSLSTSSKPLFQSLNDTWNFFDDDEAPQDPKDVFLNVFMSSPTIRDFTVAILLFTNTLEIGGPTGFSLLFYTASSGQNSFLRSFCTFLAKDLWGETLSASLWREEHLLAQWQRLKPQVLWNIHYFREHFTHDHHTPFPYASQEARQELMAHLSLWRAKLIKEQAVKHSFSALPEEKKGWLKKKFKEELFLCSGYLTFSRFLRMKTGEHYQAPLHSPYEGSLYPAGDISCLQELLREDFVSLSRGEREALTSDLYDLSTRALLFYKLSSRVKIKDTLPSFWSQFSDTVLIPPLRSVPKKASQIYEEGDDEPDREFTVEPYRTEDYFFVQLQLGEGVFFYERLHRLTGGKWSADVLRVWNKVCSWLGKA